MVLSNSDVNICGVKDWNDKVWDVEVTVPHWTDSATIMFTSSLDEDANNESWAIRDLYIYYEECKEDCFVVA
jgi:hypothetical protein